MTISIEIAAIGSGHANGCVFPNILADCFFPHSSEPWARKLIRVYFLFGSVRMQACPVNTNLGRSLMMKTPPAAAAVPMPIAPLTTSAQSFKANRRVSVARCHRKRNQKTSSNSIRTANDQVSKLYIYIYVGIYACCDRSIKYRVIGFFYCCCCCYCRDYHYWCISWMLSHGWKQMKTRLVGQHPAVGRIEYESPLGTASTNIIYNTMRMNMHKWTPYQQKILSFNSISLCIQRAHIRTRRYSHSFHIQYNVL